MQGDTIPFQGREVDLLSSVAEQLKVPLSLIARQAELSQLTQDPKFLNAEAIHAHADAALLLVEGYLLGLALHQSRMELELEPVSVSSVLHDTAHTLQRFAKQYDVSLELHIGGRYEPVMAHTTGLKTAFLSLGLSLIETYGATAPHRDKMRPPIILATHRTPHGIVAGIYGVEYALAAREWRTAQNLMGRASQPFIALGHGPAAGIFVADTILRAMESKLRVGGHRGQRGMAGTLLPSKQLALV